MNTLNDTDLIDYISHQLNVPSINIDSTQENTPEWDSINHMTLISNLSQKFSFQLDAEIIYKLRSVKEIISFLNGND